MKKRILSILLSLVMVSGMMPEPVHAAAPGDIRAIETQEELENLEEDSGQPEEETPDMGQEAPGTEEEEKDVPEDITDILEDDEKSAEEEKNKPDAK